MTALTTASSKLGRVSVAQVAIWSAFRTKPDPSRSSACFPGAARMASTTSRCSIPAVAASTSPSGEPPLRACAIAWLSATAAHVQRGSAWVIRAVSIDTVLSWPGSLRNLIATGAHRITDPLLAAEWEPI
jgi:hypothetical protein